LLIKAASRSAPASSPHPDQVVTPVLPAESKWSAT
jgi:hypothetical protein